MQFYVTRGGEPAGPLSGETVVAMIQRKELTGGDEVWREGAPEPLTVARLLGSRTAAEADARMLDGFQPAPSSQPFLRRQRDEDSFWDFVADLLSYGPWGCLTGCGLLSGLGGGGLVAIFCVGLYLWGTFDMNRRGAQERALEALRAKIVGYVDQNPQLGAVTLQQLRDASVVDHNDQDLIEETGAKYHAISANSPSEAIVFTRRGSNTERRYYKSEATNFVIWWDSPDGRVSIVSAPKSPSVKSRIVSVCDRIRKRALDEYETEAFSVHAKWRPDGRVAAIQENEAGGVGRLRLLMIDGERVRRLPLPADLSPDRFISLAGKEGEPKWYSNQINPERWLESGSLVVESYGGVSLLDAHLRPVRSLSARRRFELQITVDGRVVILSQEDVSRFEQSLPPKAEAIRA